MNKRLLLNLGVRLDFYPAFKVKATSSRPAEIVNLESPTDLRLMDFGAPRARRYLQSRLAERGAPRRLRLDTG